MVEGLLYKRDPTAIALGLTPYLVILRLPTLTGKAENLTTKKFKWRKRAKRRDIMKYVCNLCGWEYDEEVGAPEMDIAPGTAFADLPEDFACPLCGAGKDEFSENA